MPDLKSELEKVLHAWDHSEQPTQTSTPEPSMDQTTVTQHKMRVSELAFNFVRNNPGATSRDVASHLRNQGVIGSTPISISHSLMTRGLLRREGKQMYATQDVYPSRDEVKAKQLASIKKAKAAYLQKRAEARAKAARKAAKAIKEAKFPRKKREVAPPTIETPPIMPVPPAPIPTDADQLLATMNVMQAKAVYAKLKEIFG